MHADSDRLFGPVCLAAAAFALLGVAASAVSTHLAVAAGEPPVTVLPFGATLAAAGVAVIFAARALSVAVLWLAVDQWRPRFVARTLAGTGLFYLLLGVWQAWLMLART